MLLKVNFLLPLFPKPIPLSQLYVIKLCLSCPVIIHLAALLNTGKASTTSTTAAAWENAEKQSNEASFSIYKKNAVL